MIDGGRQYFTYKEMEGDVKKRYDFFCLARNGSPISLEKKRCS